MLSWQLFLSVGLSLLTSVAGSQSSSLCAGAKGIAQEAGWAQKMGEKIEEKRGKKGAEII